MDAVFKKLNFKGHHNVLVLNSPDSFKNKIEAMMGLTHFYDKIDQAESIGFAIVFVIQQSEIDQWATQIAPKLEGDAVLWFCYPKASSKKYRCDFNRDTGWKIMGKYNMEAVRQVAIDEDWSALRFRKVEYIKKITRSASFALSQEAKQRTTKKKD